MTLPSTPLCPSLTQVTSLLAVATKTPCFTLDPESTVWPGGGLTRQHVIPGYENPRVRLIYFQIPVD